MKNKLKIKPLAIPGMAIFITITIYNMIAEAMRDALDPRLKN